MCKESNESAALSALAVEARKQGITYGKLVANTTAAQQKTIIDRYLNRGSRAKKRKK